MISVSNLSVHFTGDYLFDNVSFLIGDRDRIGLVGKNGAGKTTLMRIIAGEMASETGVVASPSGSSIGYLPQQVDTSSRRNVLDEAMTAFTEAQSLHETIEKLTNKLAERTDYESDSYNNLINRLHDATDRFHMIGGNTIQEDAEKVLKGLGFDTAEFQRPVSTLSGGWQMRVELAKILLRSPDVVLLDEPTNHLDIESIQWLEEFLINYRGAVMIVSHDRAFLDNVTTRTIEIMLGRIYDFKAGYSEYVELRREQLELQKAAYDNQQQQIAQIDRFVERFRYKSTKARQVQSRIKMLDKMDKIELDEVDSSAIHFRFPPAPRSGRVVVEASSLTKRFGDKLVLSKLEFAIEQGDFVAFVGRNGEGKTTLAKIITGNLQYEGQCKIGHNVVIGYYAQNQAEMLDQEKTVFQTIDDVAVGDMRPKVRNILGSFLFGGDAIDKKVKVLSGGEKARLAIAQLLLKPVNLLVLDEPTNHLDMVSKDILKNALLRFDGTLIIVSHDRDFLQGLTDKVFEFRNHEIKPYLGDVYAFLEARKLQSLSELERKKLTRLQEEQAINDKKLNYERRKQQEREVRKAASVVKKLEEEINSLEAEIVLWDARLNDPASHTDSATSAGLFRDYNKLKESLDQKVEQWSLAHEEMEKLQNED
ncbi:MAG TPA: ATP-binding cassette domain-containing protein [Bacteroidales bacterium]|nr:ATP-binding cassette domain-containing protein [Bacteroidales bacterium]